MSSQPPDTPTPKTLPDPQQPVLGKPLPLPYEPNMWQSGDYEHSSSFPHGAQTNPAMPTPVVPPGVVDDAPTAPSRLKPPQDQPKKRRPWWWLLLIPLALLLLLLLLLCPFLHQAAQQIIQQGKTLPTVTATATRTSQQTNKKNGGGPGVGNSATATAESHRPGSSTPGSSTPPASSTVTTQPTASPRPTATPVPGAFSISAVQIQQNCTLVLPLPSFMLTLYNHTSGPVGYQTDIITDMPGTSTPWASASPASGTIPAGNSRQVTVTPNSSLCTDSLLSGTQPFVLTISAVSGATGTFTVTDSVTAVA
jgi:cytoskeletal protein RodZ